MTRVYAALAFHACTCTEYQRNQNQKGVVYVELASVLANVELQLMVCFVLIICCVSLLVRPTNGCQLDRIERRARVLFSQMLLVVDK
jgi:hypothetical protein